MARKITEVIQLMEIKQHILNNQWVTVEIRNSDSQMKIRTHLTRTCGTQQRPSQHGKLTAMGTHIRKLERSEINNLMMNLHS
jgi:hypothetical protein